MSCSEWSDLLNEFVDGTLAPAARERVEAHLAECPACRAEATALGELVAEARRLPREVTPPAAVWSGIEARIGAAPVPRSAPPGGGRRWVGLGLRLAAALGLILFGAALATVWQRRAEPDFAQARAHYVEASARLAQQLAENPGDLAPATRAVVERNLAIVDQAIREAEDALEADPHNTALEQMLLARYQQRLGLLRRATAVGHQES